MRNNLRARIHPRVTLFLGVLLLTITEVSALSIWTSSENVARALKTLTPQFEKDFGHKVSITILNKDLTTQFKTAAIAGKGPDILCWANDVVGELASSGLIEPLLLDKKFRQNFYPSALKSFTYEGKTYGYPYDVEAVALIRNKKLKPKPFQSFEELMLWSKSNIKEDSFPFLFDIKNFYFNFMFISAGGGYVFGEKELGAGTVLNPQDIGLDNIGAIKGVNFLKDLTKEGIISTSTNRNIAFEKMLKGKLVATIDGPWAIKDLERAGIPYQVDPLPSLGKQASRPFVGTHGFIIRRSSENKDLAKELIEKYLVTAEGLATLYEEDPRGPSRPDTLEILKNKLSEKELENLKAFSQSAAQGIPMPNISAMGPVWNSMGAALELILQKDHNTKLTLAKAKKRILKAINETKPQGQL